MNVSEMLERVKQSLRITTDAFDIQITSLINSAVLDLGIAGVEGEVDDLMLTAITTYVAMHFGDPDNYDRLKLSYAEQKAQLQMSTGYTTWVVTNG